MRWQPYDANSTFDGLYTYYILYAREGFIKNRSRRIFFCARQNGRKLPRRAYPRIGFFLDSNIADLILPATRPYLRGWRTKSYRHKNQIFGAKEPNLIARRYGCIFRYIYVRWISDTCERPSSPCISACVIPIWARMEQPKNRTIVISLDFGQCYSKVITKAK